MSKFQWLDDEQLIQNRILEDAEKPVHKLFEQLRAVNGDISLLRFLATHPNTQRTIEDIAYFVKRPVTVVSRNLGILVDLGLARCTPAVGIRFFGLTEDPEQQAAVHDLCTLQDIWSARLTRIEDVINGHTHRRRVPRDT